MWILTGDTPPTPPLISIVIEEKVETPPPKPITWQDNPNQCDQTTQWIALESPFYCIEKPKPRKHTTSAVSTARTAENESSVGNTYQAGQCVWHVKNLKPSIPNGWHSAKNWLSNARADGWTVSSTPVVGAVGIAGNHAVYVTAVNSDTVTISEMNYNWTPYETRIIDRPIGYFTYIY